jgi:hypothetical protein
MPPADVIVFSAAYGSAGDVLPCIALAARARQRSPPYVGVVVVANPHFKARSPIARFQRLIASPFN